MNEHAGLVTVKNAFLCKPIAEVNITIYSSDNKILSSLKTDKEGRFYFLIDNASFISLQKTGFQKKQMPVDNLFPKIIRMLEDNIIGYQDKHGFTPGEEITTYIHSPEKFTAALFRNGLKVEKEMNLGTFNPIIQDIPNGFFVETGLNWTPSLKYNLPENLSSGLYSLHLTSLENKEKKYNISFVVSPKPENYGKKTKLLVLASTNNWQTYNIWGGRSRYRNFEINDSLIKGFIHLKIQKLLPETIKNKLKELLKKKIAVSIKDHPDAFQFNRLSIKRPHPNCSINSTDPNQSFTSHLAEGEWRILAWLEKQNYEYDIITGFDLHKNPELLKNYKTLILSTHSEYWSKEMFNGLKLFFNEGGDILNLSGNSIYREVEYYDDASLRCVSLKFNETFEDETQLIGVRYNFRGYGTCAPYKVLEPDHWIFKNTGLKRTDLFGKESLNNQLTKLHPDFIRDPDSRPGMALLSGKGGSGWETDKLSTTAPADIKIVAKGTNKSDGGADMIVREPNGHGMLFSASSITFGGTLLVDEACSTIIRNVILKCSDHLTSK